MKKLFNKIAKQFSKGNELRFVWWNLIFQTFFAYSGVKYGGLRFDDIFVVIFFLPFGTFDTSGVSRIFEC